MDLSGTMIPFSEYYNKYLHSVTTGTPTQNWRKLHYYFKQKEMFYEFQVIMQNKVYDFTTSPDLIYVQHNNHYYQSGKFVFLFQTNGWIKIAKIFNRDQFNNLTTSIENWSINSITPCVEITLNEDYVQLENAMIVFREKHNEFYNLLVEGKVAEAFVYATRVLNKYD